MSTAAIPATVVGSSAAASPTRDIHPATTRLASAAQRGARAGALSGAQTSDVTAAVSTFLTNSGINGATTIVNPSPPSSAYPGQTITVTISVPYASVSWIPTPKYLGGKTLSASSLVVSESGT